MRTERTLPWYTNFVTLTSTEFRKNMFQLVERVLQGEMVEILHKGRLVRLVPEEKPGKMSRLVQRDTINGTPEDLALAQQQLDDETRTACEDKWVARPI
jgi:antitoxin (DNA-binding transcriptional repressor) of toxin-antitoxin stability system